MKWQRNDVITQPQHDTNLCYVLHEKKGQTFTHASLFFNIRFQDKNFFFFFFQGNKVLGIQEDARPLGTILYHYCLSARLG